MSRSQKQKQVIDEDVLPRSILISSAIHAVLLLVLIIMQMNAGSRVVSYIPSIQVDLVALPTVAKREYADKGNASADKGMVAPENGKGDKRDRAKRKKRMQSALDKLKAISKIEESLKRGNKLSQGGASFGERDGKSDPYLDTIMTVFKTNWQLPVWLGKKDLSARVVIQIDSDGRIRNHHFLKGSGNKQFDDYVLRTINLCDPLEPPPKRWRGILARDGLIIGFPL